MSGLDSSVECRLMASCVFYCVSISIQCLLLYVSPVNRRIRFGVGEYDLGLGGGFGVDNQPKHQLGRRALQQRYEAIVKQADGLIKVEWPILR